MAAPSRPGRESSQSGVRLRLRHRGRLCAECRAHSGPHARYCSQCGAALLLGTGGDLAGGAAREEFRRVVILFADLVGSTALAERLEAEAAYRLVGETVSGLTRIVSEHQGYVVKTLGDGLMALFGAPVANSDDPLRAARAALAMQAWMAETPAAQEGVRLRVGVNYGSVVAGAITTGGRALYDALGDAVNVAQRTEAAAEPGSVCVTETFYRLTRTRFAFTDIGAARVRGKSEPLHLYRLLGERDQPLGGELILPLTGRDAEMERLRQWIADLQERWGRRVAIRGPEGVGKTRLLDELESELAAAGVPLLRATGSESLRQTPLALWQEWILALLPLQPEMSLAEARRALAEALPASFGADEAEVLAALAVDPRSLLVIDPDTRRHLTETALHALVRHWQGSRPAALLIDSVDQVDTLSVAVLHSISCRDVTAPLLLATTAAPGHPDGADAEILSLEPLPPNEVRRLLEQGLPGTELQQHLVGEIVERSGGLPLFVQVMVRSARDHENPLSVLQAVPDDLYSLVQAQVDSLQPEERRVAQCAAVLGKSFAERWLSTLLGCEPQQQPPPWQSLEAQGMLLEQQSNPHRELAFRHGAFREVIYSGMLSRQRRQAHARIAPWLAAEAEVRRELSARVAAHYRHAGEATPAMEWTLSAADYAASLYAVAEAEDLYREALEAARALGSARTATLAASGLAELAAHRGDFPQALQWSDEASEYLQRLEAAAGTLLPEVPAAVRLIRARLLGRLGRTSEALPILRQALAAVQHATEPGALRERVRCRIEEAHLLRELGLLEEGAASAQLALEEAEGLGWREEAASAGSALGLILPELGQWEQAERVLRRAAATAVECRDWKGASGTLINLGNGLRAAGHLFEAVESYDHALELANRIGDAEKVALVRLSLGTTHLNRGAWLAAAASLRAALADFRRMEHHLGALYALYNLGETQRWAGETAAARDSLTEAEQLLAAVEAPAVAAHLLALRAELLLAEGQLEEAARLATKGVRVAEEAGHDSGVRLGRLVAGRVFLRQDRLTAAEQELTAAVEGFRQAGEPLEEARARAELASLHARRGEHDAAQRLRQAAIGLLQRLGAEPWQAHFPST